jgi:hypothetical protein
VHALGTIASWTLLNVEAHMTTADSVNWLIGRRRAAARLEGALSDDFAPA